MTRISGWCSAHGEQQHARRRSATCECPCGPHPRAFVQVRGQIGGVAAVEVRGDPWGNGPTNQSDPARCVNTICAGPRRTGMEFDQCLILHHPTRA